MFKNLFKTIFLITSLASLNTNATVIVDLELQLLADISGSVSASEYNLQLQGYKDAFNDASVVNAILAGTVGAIAVQYIEWSESAAIGVDWTFINSVASASAFAASLGPRISSGTVGSLTAPGTAINFGSPLFASNLYQSTRQVMDVSGDGTRNTGANTSAARDAALALGIDTINGITIGGLASLDAWYLKNIIGGTNAFLNSANTFTDFTVDVRNKLKREIQGKPVPEPPSIALLGLAVIGLFSASRKKT